MEEGAVSSSLLEEVDCVVVLLREGCWEEDLIPLDLLSSTVASKFSFESLFLFNLFSIAKVSASSSIAVFPYFV